MEQLEQEASGSLLLPSDRRTAFWWVPLTLHFCYCCLLRGLDVNLAQPRTWFMMEAWEMVIFPCVLGNAALLLLFQQNWLPEV